MALTSWKGSIVRKQDIFIAKNYLTADELDTLNRLVVIFLETAELRAKDRQDLTIEFWKENVDRIISSNDRVVLTDKGSVSNAQMEEEVRKLYAQFEANRRTFEASESDKNDLQELEELQIQIKSETDLS